MESLLSITTWRLAQVLSSIDKLNAMPHPDELADYAYELERKALVAGRAIAYAWALDRYDHHEIGWREVRPFLEALRQAAKESPAEAGQV